MINLLLIDDEKNLCLTLVSCLETEGFHVEAIHNGYDGLKRLENKLFDLIILDLSLPDEDGFILFQKILQKFPDIPTIFLTARQDWDARIQGLSAGAEDYITKPFSLQELILRIKKALRKSTASSCIRIGKAHINFDTFEAKIDGKVIWLNQKEVKLLKFLYGKKGKVVSRNEILDHVWSANEFPTPRTIDNFIVRLRKIVENNPNDPKIIRSIWGVGYQLYDSLI